MLWLDAVDLELVSRIRKRARGWSARKTCQTRFGFYNALVCCYNGALGLGFGKDKVGGDDFSARGCFALRIVPIGLGPHYAPGHALQALLGVCPFVLRRRHHQ